MTEIPGRGLRQAVPARYTCSRALDPDVYKITDDEQMVIDLLEQQHMLLTPRHRLQPADDRPPAGWCSWPRFATLDDAQSARLGHVSCATTTSSAADPAPAGLPANGGRSQPARPWAARGPRRR